MPRHGHGTVRTIVVVHSATCYPVVMRSTELRRLLKKEPFAPLRVCLSDARCVLIRHPDQAVVSERVLFVGVTKVEQSRPSMTPARSETIAKDWLMINLLQISTVEPINGNGRARQRRRGK